MKPPTRQREVGSRRAGRKARQGVMRLRAKSPVKPEPPFALPMQEEAALLNIE
ncbi:MAG: hypothetical protein QXQ57_04555 [Sulfolobales archaeon]